MDSSRQPIKNNHVLWTSSKIIKLLDLLAAIALLTLAGAVSLERWEWMAKEAFPLDYGGFYYLQEIKHRLDTGTGYYEKFSVFFSAAASLAKVLPCSDVSFLYAVIWSSILVLAAGIAAGVSLKRNSLSLSAVLFYLVWRSDSIFIAHYAYPRQAWAMAVLAVSIALLLHAQAAAERKWLQNLGIALLLVSALFHLFAGVLALILAFVLGWPTIKIGKRATQLLCAGLCLIAAVRLFAQPKFILENIVWNTQAVWNWAYDLFWISRLQRVEYISYFCAACCFIAIGLASAEKRIRYWILWGVFLVLTLPIWKQEFGQYAFRFLRCSSWVFFIAAMLSLSQPGTKKIQEICGKLVIVALLPVIVFFRQTLEDRPQAIGPGVPAAPFADLKDPVKDWLAQDAFVLAPHGMQFRVSYFWDCASATELPRDKVFSAYYRVGFGAPPHKNCLAAQFAASTESHQVDCLYLGERLFIWKMK